MISVCMATYNGRKYLKEQMDSILSQLGPEDELIISDDGSTDGTDRELQSYRDKRIVVLNGPKKGVALNFENALRLARGEYVFLSDQDDVWKPEKISVMISYLKNADLVVSDCCIVDENLQERVPSYYALNAPRKGFWNNWIHNHYFGCCMAFRRKVLDDCLPFPRKVILHDIWIGLVAEMYYNTEFIPQRLIYYRRHGENASSVTGKSSYSMREKLSFRFYIIGQIFLRHIKRRIF
ncbi:MAG: glycosyltransferase family 2 protein [Paludibacteraceae bacterium]|nr:glycosyltransferase family 2 protein [Paludibacteraceae bacterium]